jgi:hypothetical protein
MMIMILILTLKRHWLVLFVGPEKKMREDRMKWSQSDHKMQMFSLYLTLINGVRIRNEKGILHQVQHQIEWIDDRPWNF